MLNDKCDLYRVEKAIRKCHSERNVVKRRWVARAAEEGSLTEGFEVLDSCHKSVCSLKRV
jgi:hypothetical protein